jgi:hypothetical protein
MSSPENAALTVIESAGKIVTELTNAVGLLGKNLDAAIAIRNTIKREHLHKNLCSLLESLTSWRTHCQSMYGTLLKLAEEAQKREIPIEEIHARVKELARQGNLRAELEAFANHILNTKDILDQLKPELTAMDYKLYEELAANIEARESTISVLKAADSKTLSDSQIMEVSRSYERLIASVTCCKDKIQERLRELEK